VARQVKSRINVGLHDSEGVAQVLADCGVYQFDLEIPHTEVVRVVVPADADADALLARLVAHPGVRFAEFDRVGEYHVSLSDPLVGSTAPVAARYYGTAEAGAWGGAVGEGGEIVQRSAYDLGWHLGVLGLYDAWETTKGNPQVNVALNDSGLMNGGADHPDFGSIAFNKKARILDDDVTPLTVTGINIGECSDERFIGHGTMVFSEVFAPHNGVGIAGIAPECGRIMVSCHLWESTAAAALVWAAEAGTTGTERAVVSNSYGVTGYGDTSFTMQSAINTARTKGHDGKGVIVVASTGNGGFSVASKAALPSPANATGCLSVGAVVHQNQRYNRSMYGAGVDLVGPTLFGAALMNCDGLTPATIWEDVAAGTYYWEGSGTSSSTPAVAAVLGLVWSVNPALTNDQVIAIVKSATAPFVDPQAAADFPSMSGVANAAKAVAKMKTTLAANAGVVFPVALFIPPDWTENGQAVTLRDGAGVCWTHLRDTIWIDASGYCSTGPVTRVVVRLGGQVIRDGAPGVFSVDTSAWAGGAVEITAYTASGAAGTRTYPYVVPTFTAGLAAGAMLSGHRRVDRTVTVNGQPTSEPTTTTWAYDAASLEGEIVTVSDGVDSLEVEVQGVPGPRTVRVEAGGSPVLATLVPGADLGPLVGAASFAAPTLSAAPSLPTMAARGAMAALDISAAPSLPTMAGAGAMVAPEFLSPETGHRIRVVAGGTAVVVNVVPGADLGGFAGATAMAAVTLSAEVPLATMAGAGAMAVPSLGLGLSSFAGAGAFVQPSFSAAVGLPTMAGKGAMRTLTIKAPGPSDVAVSRWRRPRAWVHGRHW
jgi:subtilisin family serine protease